jgi:thioredoxin-related protein
MMISRKMFMATVCTIIAISFSNSVSAQEAWKTNVDEALKESKENGKTVVVLFTGTEWCPPCQKMEAEVFTKEEFTKPAIESYELVKLDFPRDRSKMPPHNEEWSSRLAVSSFPSVILLDMQGRPFAKTGGYVEGGPENYLKHLGELAQVLVTRDEAFDKAEKAEGGEKAQWLDQALATLPEEFISDHYEDVIKQIVALDSKDELGLRTKYYAAQDKEARKEILAKIAMVSRTLKSDQAIKEIDTALAQMTLPAMMRIQALQMKLGILRKDSRSEDAEKLLDEMIRVEGIDAETRNRLIVQKAYFLVSTDASAAALTMLEEKISSQTENMDLFIAKGELLDRLGKSEQALDAFDQALLSADGDSERIAEILALKTEALLTLDKMDEALQLLGDFALNEAHPGYLRADALVQKSILLRQAKREDAANLAEDQALELVTDPTERAALRRLIDSLNKQLKTE